MSNLIINFPTDEEEEANLRFKTYNNYLKAIAILITGSYKNYDVLISKVKSTKSFSLIKKNININTSSRSKIKKILFNSWNTELILNFPLNDDSLKLYSNHWMPVQIYYSVYLLLRALFICCGASVKKDHTSTLKSISNWIQTSTIFIFPWDVSCCGFEKLGNLAFTNCTKVIDLKDVSNLSNPDSSTSIDIYCKCLKTTRERKIKIL